MSLPDTLQLLLDPSYRLQLLLGFAAISLLSLLAVYVVSARLLITGLALAQVASFGAALSLHVAGDPALLTAGVTALAAGAAPLLRHRRFPADAGLLLLFLGGGAGAVLLTARAGTGESHATDLMNGQLLIAGMREVWGVGAALLLVLVLWGSGWTALLLDLTQRDFARQSGIPVARWESAALIALGAAVGAGFPALGVVLTVACLTCPGLVALLFARSLRAMPLLALATGWIGYGLGVVLAFATDWPPGPTIAGALVALTVAATALGTLRPRRR